MTGLMPELTAGRRDESATPRPKMVELRDLKFLLPAEAPPEADLEALLNGLDEDPSGSRAALGFLRLMLGPDGFKRLMDGIRDEIVSPADLPSFITSIYGRYLTTEGVAR